MQILILGSGVIGVMSAYFLAEKGHEVMVIDSAAGPGMGTSYANGAQLSYSKAYPLSNLTTLKKLPKYLFGKDSPIHIRTGFDLDFYRWGAQFLIECFRSGKNSEEVMAIALKSREVMHSLVQRHEINFDYARKGKLYVFSDKNDFELGIKHVDEAASHGIEQRILNATQAVELEPALADMRKDIYGAIYSVVDESGDARKFCEEMVRICTEKGVKFNFGETLKSVRAEKGKITAVITDKNEHVPDKIVFCLGTQAGVIARRMGIYLPIYPMKGYSITVPATARAPEINITDEARRVVYSKIGDRLRIAGIAEFAGHDLGINRRIMDGMIDIAKRSFPHAGDYSRIEEWAGLRPMTPSTVPIIRQSGKYSNLYFNTGHGMLGWTLSGGSAVRLAEMI